MHALSQPLGHPAPISMAVLGDSLAYGLGASAVELGLAHLLHARLRANRPASTLFTFAVPHSTMGDVLRHQVPHVRGLSVDLVLVVAGANDLRYTRDVIVITRRFRNLLEAIHDAAPGAQVWTVDGATHVEAYAKDPQRYLDRITQFFNDGLKVE